jgi:hypothetical protein
MEKLTPWLIDAFVGMGTEEIALGLEEIRGQARGPITIEESQRCRECRSGHA